MKCVNNFVPQKLLLQPILMGDTTSGKNSASKTSLGTNPLAPNVTCGLLLVMLK
jgi:hypothetical protein